MRDEDVFRNSRRRPGCRSGAASSRCVPGRACRWRTRRSRSTGRHRDEAFADLAAFEQRLRIRADATESVPSISWPSVCGSVRPLDQSILSPSPMSTWPSCRWTSEWQTPECEIFTSTSVPLRRRNVGGDFLERLAAGDDGLASWRIPPQVTCCVSNACSGWEGPTKTTPQRQGQFAAMTAGFRRRPLQLQQERLGRRRRSGGAAWRGLQASSPRRAGHRAACRRRLPRWEQAQVPPWRRAWSGRRWAKKAGRRARGLRLVARMAVFMTIPV